MNTSNTLSDVLYILFDDLRPEFGFLDSEGLRLHHTPNFDRLSREGAFFDLAFSQVAFCAPSRASFLTGLRPDSTGSVHNDQLERFGVPRSAPLPHGITVFDAFKRSGYTTAAVGKIFHFGEAHPSLDLPVVSSTQDLLGRPCDSVAAVNVQEPRAGRLFGFPKACDLPFGSFVDQRVTAHSVRYLRRLSSGGHARPPFMLAVGYLRPHNPYQFPAKYLEGVARANETDVATVFRRHESQPGIAFADQGDCIHQKCQREQRRFYRAAVSYVDALLGLLLKEVRKLKLENSALVVVHADHGISLGENGAWQKRTNFDHASRVPLFIRDPRTSPAADGLRVRQPVELVDVLPTLLDLSGVASRYSMPGHLQGRSLRPFLDGTCEGFPRSCSFPHLNLDRFKHAFMLQPRLLYVTRNTTHPPFVDGGLSISEIGMDSVELEKGVAQSERRKADPRCSSELAFGGVFGPGRSCRIVAMGYSVRSRSYRYTRWERWPAHALGGDNHIWTAGKGTLLAEELYNHSAEETGGGRIGNGVSEQVNLAAQGAPASFHLRSIKLELMHALVAHGARGSRVMLSRTKATSSTRSDTDA